MRDKEAEEGEAGWECRLGLGGSGGLYWEGEIRAKT